MSNILISWSNTLGLYTIGSSVTPSTVHPIENLQDPLEGKPTRWDMTGSSALDLTWSGSANRTANCFFLSGHNMEINDSMTLSLYTGENQTGTQTDVVPAGTRGVYVVPTNERAVGIDIFGTYYNDFDNLKRVFTANFPNIQYKSAKLSFNISSSIIFQVDKLRLDYGWMPDKNISYGSEFTFKEFTRIQNQNSSGVKAIRGNSVRTLDLVFTEQSDQDTAVMSHILGINGFTKDLGIIGYPDETGIKRLQSSGIFRRVNETVIKPSSYKRNTLSYTFQEN